MTSVIPEASTTTPDPTEQRTSSTPALRKRLVVEQADLDAGTPMFFRPFDDEIRMAYDPAQMPPVAAYSRQSQSMAARSFLGMHHDYTEGPELDALRETHRNEPEGSPLRDVIGMMFDDIDRTQDPAGIAAQYVELLEQTRAKKAGART
ncbi:hypothetical protein [Streptomyces sp. SID12501]|uniref:Uncharacterized protein n=1 Tax=Streptomyces sp. SID12501 TaxID=2706042 RepID=A0A6B3C164_9ACTN|nr:hypothetical protein [Streptomyces sp. SID12501]NEC90447.1 hypothetical protein [Streptomyces sp. SID12501]